MRGLVILTLAMLPDAALAQCPDRAALEHGKTAYVTYPDGETVGLRWMGEGVIEETTRFEGEGQDFRMLSLGGVFVIDEVDLDVAGVGSPLGGGGRDARVPLLTQFGAGSGVALGEGTDDPQDVVVPTA